MNYCWLCLLNHGCLLPGIHFSHPLFALLFPSFISFWARFHFSLPVLLVVPFPPLSSGCHSVCKTTEPKPDGRFLSLCQINRHATNSTYAVLAFVKATSKSDQLHYTGSQQPQNNLTRLHGDCFCLGLEAHLKHPSR